MGGLARDPLLPHANLLGGCVSGGVAYKDRAGQPPRGQTLDARQTSSTAGAGGREANTRHTESKNNLQYNRIIERRKPTFAGEQDAAACAAKGLYTGNAPHEATVHCDAAVPRIAGAGRGSPCLTAREAGVLKRVAGPQSTPSR